jgi:hypothetical protein
MKKGYEMKTKSECLQTWHEIMTDSKGVDSYNNYMGDTSHAHDYLVLTQTRDSDCLTRSNFICAYDYLKQASKENVYIIRHGHWGCGWIEHIMVKPGSPCQKIAEEITCFLADYPVLNDSHCSEIEYNDALEYWQSLSDITRLKYIRKNKDQFDFINFKELYNNVKGQYFNGIASELLF